MTPHSISIIIVRAQDVLFWRSLHQLRYQLRSVEGRAKSPTVPQRSELVIGTRAAEQDSE